MSRQNRTRAGHLPDRTPLVRTDRLLSVGSGAFVFALLACLTLLGLEAWHARAELLARLHEVEVSTANLARSLGQHTDDTFDMADAVLVDLAEYVRTDGTGREAQARLQRLLAEHAAHLPDGVSFFVYGRDGSWLATSLPDAPEGISNADREYFRFHAASTESGPHLGLPIRSRSRGNWIIPLSRGIRTQDGSFAGVVLATFDAERFARHYAGFDTGQSGAIGLLRTDGVLLARDPFDPAAVGRSMGGNELFRIHLPEAAAGTYELVSPFDGVERISAWQRSARYPLVVLVAVARSEALADWRNDAMWRAGVVLALAVLLGAFGVRLARLVRQRFKAERALVESEANFRLLAERSSDVVVRIDPDGRFRYVSPASARVLGRPPESLVGTGLLEGADPEDRPAVEAALAGLRAGEADEATLVYRLQRETGRETWVEAAIRSTRDAAPALPDGAIAVLRDISARKRLEAELEARASTDALTGLGNRRRFDEVMAQEWRRAAREGTPLSLLLLDVDRFKLFNDSYGHQEGDACLRAVAAAVARTIRRPADFAARYGGEELAVVLPGTQAAGALEMAEQVRAAVQGLALPHGGSLPAGVVTASVGAATTMPIPGASVGPEALIAAADKALYQAKHQGRNRVVGTTRVPPAPAAPPTRHDEAARLAAVAEHVAAGATAPGDADLDRITRMAAMLFGTPTALLSVVGPDRVDFAARVGLEAAGAPRDVAFCSHTVAQGGETLVVPDLAMDPSFAGNPLVAGEAGLRFYVGAPLVSPSSGHRLGALCVLDRVPREPLNPGQQKLLVDLAALAAQRIEQRRMLAGAVTGRAVEPMERAGRLIGETVPAGHS